MADPGPHFPIDPVRPNQGRNYTPGGLPDQPDGRFGYRADRAGCRRRPFLTVAIAVVLVIVAVVITANTAGSGDFIEYPMGVVSTG